MKHVNIDPHPDESRGVGFEVNMSVINDLLEKYQIRKTNGQKTEFIGYATELARSKGYSVRVEGNGEGYRNIVIGEPEHARVIYTAHYDTPPVMPVPNFIAPRCFPIYLLYQIFVVALLLIVPLAAALPVSYLAGKPELGILLFLVLYYVELFLMLFGPANKHNANDNTSGVATVLGIMERTAGSGLPVAFVLFDCEERGLVGSKAYNKAHKQMMKDKLVVNFDCVGDGKHMMFVAKKGGAEYLDRVAAAFKSEGEMTALCYSKGVFYPSDQNSFPTAIGVASMRRTSFGLLYTGRIHTARDTVLDEGNVEYLVNGSVALATSFASTEE